jgi:hypothetical protein
MIQSISIKPDTRYEGGKNVPCSTAWIDYGSYVGNFKESHWVVFEPQPFYFEIGQLTLVELDGFTVGNSKHPWESLINRYGTHYKITRGSGYCPDSPKRAMAGINRTLKKIAELKADILRSIPHLKQAYSYDLHLDPQTFEIGSQTCHQTPTGHHIIDHQGTCLVCKAVHQTAYQC